MLGLDPATLLATWERGLAEGPLDRAVRLLAAASGTSVADAAGWDLGSRDALLAALLREMAGRLAWTRTYCGGCGAPLDVPVDLTVVADAPVPPAGQVLTAEVAGTEVRFRLPTTEDLRAVRELTPAAARRRLLERCLVEVDPAADDAELAGAVDAAMERACPTGAVQIAVGCPDCGATTVAALDVPALVWAELQARATALLADVHVLASAYGWTEPQVLSLSPERRAAYLELIGS
jgi:hypothetical protein